MKVYRRGEPFRSFDALVGWLCGEGWVMLRKKPVHPRVIECMTLQVVMGFLGRGMLAKAIKKEGK